MANDIAKYRLRTANPQNEGELRNHCMSIVASEREAYYGKYAQPNQTLDGLAATTSQAQNYEEEDEQIKEGNNVNEQSREYQYLSLPLILG